MAASPAPSGFEEPLTDKEGQGVLQLLVWRPSSLAGRWRLDNLREVILHVLTETAVHAGHLDAARELIDGRTWLVLTE